MNVQKCCSRLVSKSLIIFSISVLTACGGGGGDDGFSLPAAGVPYEGLTSKAILDVTTSEAIVVDMAGAELENQSGFATAGVTTGGISDADGKAMRYAAMERLKQDAFHILDEIVNPDVAGNGHVEVGDCADILGSGYSNGSASTTVLEESSTTIAVKATYNSLCTTDGFSYAVKLNGEMYMVITGSNLDNTSGRVDQMRFYMPSFTIAYTDLLISETNTVTLTEDWIIDFEYDSVGNLTSLTFTLAVNVSYAGKVYRFESIDDGFTTTDKFYHPDYGYVEITVASTFTYGSCTDPYTPDGGSVTITGSNGSGSTVTYIVTVLGCDSYSVVVD